MTLPACKLSVTIITRDEKPRSATAWIGAVADEIIVVDTGSVDRTLELCTKYTPHIHSRPWEGYAQAKNAALAFATGDWVFSLDADERVSEGYVKRSRPCNNSRWTRVPMAMPCPDATICGGIGCAMGVCIPTIRSACSSVARENSRHGAYTNRWRSMDQLSAATSHRAPQLPGDQRCHPTPRSLY
jgi:glycosyltransferase involved in cell wall biosynthesis